MGETQAYAYNVDYWSGTGTIGLVSDMIQLRYANYPKDYFMGMLPSSQYGSVAVLPSTPVGGASAVSVVAYRSGVSPNGYAVVESSTNSVSVNSQASSTRDIRVNSDLSAPNIVTGKQIGRAHV